MTTETETTPTQEASVNITLSVTDVNTVLASLQELPHRLVDALIKNIVTQAQAQLPQSSE